MAICQVMISDFLHKTGRLDYYEDGGEYELYSDFDLEVGLDYAKDLLREGYKIEPYHKYNVRKFKRWCEKQLKTKGGIDE